MSVPSYRLKGKRFHLIYSRCDATATDLYRFLCELDIDILRCRIGQEKHADGGGHLHCALELRNPLDKRNAARFFDYSGHHPQIKPKRTKPEWKATWLYVGKDGQDQTFGSPFDGEDDVPMLLSELARTSRTYLEYLDTIEKRGTQFGLAKEIWQEVNSGNETITISDENAATFGPGTLESVQLSDLPFPTGDLRSLVLQGPPQIGKSTWAIHRMPRPCLWVTHIDDLCAFRSGYHVSIIFDDMCFQHLPRQTQLHLACNRQARSLHCRYVRAKLPRGLFKVFTCNMGSICFPFKTILDNGLEDDALLSRLNIIIVK